MVSATYFTIKNIPILTVLYRKKQNVKFHFAVDLRMQPPITHHPPKAPPAGCWVLPTKLFFSKNCQSKTIFQDFYGYFELLDSKIRISFLNNKIREAYFHETPHIRAHGFATIYGIY